MIDIRKTPQQPKGGPGRAAIWVRIGRTAASFNRLFIDRKGGRPEPIATDYTVKLGSGVTSHTLKAEDDGTTVIANNAAATVTTNLPKASDAGVGAKFTVVTGALPGAGAGTTVHPATGDNINAKAANADLVNSAASDAVGDAVTLVSDGVLTWFTTGKIGTWA
jgi:hypothetical protein